jgi:hypothetical protein
MRAKRSLRRAADLLSVAGVPVAEATKVLAREPNSPVTQAIKLWGDDEEPFKNLITSSASAAREWRKTMARIIAHLESDNSGRPVFRGWYFGSSAQRDEFHPETGLLRQSAHWHERQSIPPRFYQCDVPQPPWRDLGDSRTAHSS